MIYVLAVFEMDIVDIKPRHKFQYFLEKFLKDGAISMSNPRYFPFQILHPSFKFEIKIQKNMKSPSEKSLKKTSKKKFQENSSKNCLSKNEKVKQKTQVNNLKKIFHIPTNKQKQATDI
jgi:hypothetical protein